MSSLQRTAEIFLNHWYEKDNRKPLVIRGARQVGKSTLVRQFAERQGYRLAEINLEQDRSLESAFASLKSETIQSELEATARVSFSDRDVLLFLDEIQATPSALPALRYLYEARPDLPVIAAGSLLEFVLRSHDFSMPVGRIEYFHLGPMSFEEFLESLDETFLLERIRTWKPGESLAQSAHQRLVERQREFLFVGGMPEAVSQYATTKSLADASDIHRSICSTYRDDFSKYGSTSASLFRLQRIFDYIPTAVGEKIKYAKISRDERASALRAAIDLLTLARVVWRVHHSDCSGIPLRAQEDPHTYKCLSVDIGIMNHLCGIDWRSLAESEAVRLVNEGAMAEQFIGQHLLFRDQGRSEPHLNYWLREGKRNNAEIDYVIAARSLILPVEVKAGASGSMKSLHEFLARKTPSDRQSRLGLRFDLNPPSLASYEASLTSAPNTLLKYELLSLPLYMAGQVERLLDHVLEG